MSTVVFPASEATRPLPSECRFCGALTGQRAIPEPSVLETNQFVAWVSDGALVDGHLLVVPKAHSLSVRQIGELDPLMRFVADVKAYLGRHYGPIAAFEHGPAREGSGVGCSTDHAHLHLVPWEGSLVVQAELDYPHLSWIRVGGLADVAEVATASPYLFVQDADGTATLSAHPDIPSQALRRSLARAMDREEEWNWKTHPQQRTKARTLRRLQRLGA